MARSLQDLIASAEHEVDNYASGQEPAEALLALAEAGEDLSEVVDRLAVLLKRHQDTRGIEPMAAALGLELLRAGTPERIPPLVKTLGYGGEEILSQLADRADRLDLGPLVVPLLRSKLKDGQLERFFHSLLERRPEQMEAVAGLLGTRPTLLAEMVKDLTLWRNTDVSPAMAALAKALTSRSTRTLDRATWAAYTAAEGNADLGPARAPLTALLGHKDADVRTQAAYALAFEALRRGDDAGLDALTAHARADVRGEVVHAACVHLHSRKARDRVVERMAEALTDRAASVRDRALECLTSGLDKGIAYDPDPEVLARTARQAAKPAVRAWLWALVEHSADAAKGVAEHLGDRDEALAAAAARALDGRAEPPCPICVRLPASGVWISESDLPEAMSELVREEGWNACPRCHTVYANTYDCEWEDMMQDETWTLRKLTPTETIAQAPKKLALRAEKALKATIARNEAWLDHPRDAVRAEAARVLVDHWVAEGSQARLAALLKHADAAVRKAATARATHHGRKHRPSRSHLEKGLDATDPEERILCARLLVDRALPAGENAAIDAALDHPNGDVRRAVVEALDRHARHDANLMHFAPRLLAAMEDLDKEIRTFATWALSRTKLKPRLRAQRHQIWVRQLHSDDPALREEACRGLKGEVHTGGNLDDCWERLLELLEDEDTAWHANEVVKEAARQGLEVSRALPSVLEKLTQPRWRDAVDFYKTLYTLSGAMDVRAAIPAVIDLLTVEDNQQFLLTQLLEDLDEKHHALDPHLDALAAVLPELSEADRQRFAQRICARWLALGAVDEITALMKVHRDLQFGAIEAISEDPRGKELEPLWVAACDAYRSGAWVFRDSATYGLTRWLKKVGGSQAVLAALEAAPPSKQRDEALAVARKP